MKHTEIAQQQKIYKTFWEAEESEGFFEGEDELKSMEEVLKSLEVFLKELLKGCSDYEQMDHILKGQFGIAENNIVTDYEPASYILERLGLDYTVKMGYKDYSGEIITSDFDVEMIYHKNEFEFSEDDQERFRDQLIKDGVVDEDVKLKSDVFKDTSIVDTRFSKEYIEFTEVRIITDEELKKLN